MIVAAIAEKVDISQLINKPERPQRMSAGERPHTRARREAKPQRRRAIRHRRPHECECENGNCDARSRHSLPIRRHGRRHGRCHRDQEAGAAQCADEDMHAAQTEATQWRTRARRGAALPN